MKKIKKFFTIPSIFGLLLLISKQNVLADLIPISELNKSHTNIKSTLVEQDIILGIIILIVIIISIIILFKIRKNDK